MIPAKDGKSITELIYEYYEQLSLPELQKELKRIENMRRKYDFCTGLNDLRETINTKVTELKERGSSQEEISQHIDDLLTYRTVFDKNNPVHALSLAMKEAQVATVFAHKADKEFVEFKKQIKSLAT